VQSISTLLPPEYANEMDVGEPIAISGANPGDGSVKILFSGACQIAANANATSGGGEWTKRHDVRPFSLATAPG
jgi:hypothetical protein